MSNIIKGIFLANKKGFGFVDDVFIPERYSNGALHRDEVEIKVWSDFREDTRKEGAVTKLLSRGIPLIAGTFCAEKKGGYLTAMESRIPYAFDIAPSAVKKLGLVDGHNVMFQVTIEGKVQITEIFGHKNDPGMDVLSLVYQYGVPNKFSDTVHKEAAALPHFVSEDDFLNDNRADYRDWDIITIDGADTKDIDDAISLRRLIDNPLGACYELGVHIADVSHYVQPGTALDLEARERGTSIYLADRVIPMLPHKLSNGICSLNPEVDRLTLSCIMEIDDNGNVLKSRIEESVIHSKRRYTYDEVALLLEDGSDNHISTMGELAEILRNKRIVRGALDLSIKEGKAIVDDKGFPIAIEARESSPATSLIEEFMIAANESVAERFKNKPFVFRTHEEPDPEIMPQLRTALKRLPNEPSLSGIILRSLKQAKYTAENIGHYGLASKCYCHFTSPIRRYPDLLVHRAVKQGLKKRGLVDLCAHCSNTERNAEALERDVLQLKKVQFMADKVGQVFEGTVSNVVNWGIYVQLPNTIEGLIPAECLFEEYKLGDAIKVKLSKADLNERRLTFYPK